MDLSNTLFWSVVGAIVLVEGLIIFTALRMHVDSDPRRGILGARPIEVIWTVLPALLVLGLVVVSYQALGRAQ